MAADAERMPSPEGQDTSFVPLAEAYRREGLLEDAIRICREGLAKCPDALRGRIVLGQSLLDVGQIGQAIVELARVEREGRQDPEILTRLCEVHLGGAQKWAVGAEIARGSAVPVDAQATETPQAAWAEPPVLILGEAGQPEQEAAPSERSVSDPLASTTLAGLYASQGDAATADAMLRRLAPEDVPPTNADASTAKKPGADVVEELTRLRRIAERLRKTHTRSEHHE